MRAPSDFDEAVRRGVRYGQRAVVVHASRSAIAESIQRSPDSRDRAEVITDRTDEMTGVKPTTPALVGFVVSKAVGNAVTRNRVKRRMRAIVMNEMGVIPAGTKIVLRALPAAASSDFGSLRCQVRQGLQGALHKAGLKSAVSSSAHTGPGGSP